jgi:hypothetical protein
MASTWPGARPVAGSVDSAGGPGAAAPPVGLTDVPRLVMTGAG